MSVDPVAHHRVTPEGRAIGVSTAKLAIRGGARLAAAGLANLNLPTLRDEMCSTCACQPGSVPNGCLQTQMDLMKSAVEGNPFLCHSPHDGRICAGWSRVRAELVANPVPEQLASDLAKWEYSEPDEDLDVLVQSKVMKG